MAGDVVVIHEGGTAWWIPLLVALTVAAAAAVASYAAAWWFKKRDVERDNAFAAARLVDEAEQIASRRERYDVEGGAATVTRLVQEARIRAQPLASEELDDRFKAALDFAFTIGLLQNQPVGGLRWLAEAVANVREGLAAFLTAPTFWPGGERLKLKRSFPTSAELQAMPSGDDGNDLTRALNAWRNGH